MLHERRLWEIHFRKSSTSQRSQRFSCGPREIFTAIESAQGSSVAHTIMLGAAAATPMQELGAFDFSSIDDMDPSLSGGHRVMYEREVPFELRVQQMADGPQEVGTLEAVRVKVLLLGDESAPSAVRVELTSENDLFFNYVHTLDEAGFRHVQEAQKLMVDFADYPPVLTRMLDTCIREPSSHLAVFVMQRGGRGHLDFIQNMEYKFVELLSCAFMAADDETVRQSITFRYNSIKSRLALMQARLQDINALVKVKNPSLLLQLQRTPPRFPQHGGGGGLGGGRAGM